MSPNIHFLSWTRIATRVCGWHFGWSPVLYKAEGELFLVSEVNSGQIETLELDGGDRYLTRTLLPPLNNLVENSTGDGYISSSKK